MCKYECQNKIIYFSKTRKLILLITDSSWEFNQYKYFLLFLKSSKTRQKVFVSGHLRLPLNKLCNSWLELIHTPSSQLSHLSSWVPKPSSPYPSILSPVWSAALSSIPLPPLAICHTWVLTAKHLLWKDLLLFVLHSTLFWPSQIFLLRPSINKRSSHLSTFGGSVRWNL